MSFQLSVRPALQKIMLNGCLLFAIAGCGSKAAPAHPPPAVQVATVVQKDTPIFSDFVATLDGFVNAQIQPRVSGYIVKQEYVEGSVVKQGQPLFEIDPRPFLAT